MPNAAPRTEERLSDRAARMRLVRVAQGQEDADLVIRGARVVLVQTGEVVLGDVAVAQGRFAGLGSFRAPEVLDARGQFLVPGFLDAHVHIESSLLTPRRFAQAVKPHGTTGVVCEPHEIVNVLGLPGLDWMLAAGRASGLRVFASCPSSVPASKFEVGAQHLGAQDVRAGLSRDGVLGLAEVMNWPGVLGGDAEVWAILDAARGGRVDGHGAGLSDLNAYAAAGIHSDHEATTEAEARARLRAGLWLMVRDGSGARNLEALAPVLRERPRRAMLVTDDTDARELVQDGHLDRVLRKAVRCGLDPLYALALVTQHPAEYWGLHDLGLIAPGYQADFALVEDLHDWRVTHTQVAQLSPGREVALPEGGGVQLGEGWRELPLHVPPHFPVIGVQREQIVTLKLPPSTGNTVKLASFARHGGAARVGVARAAGVGLSRGAIGLSVQHDAHHLLVAGASDDDLRACAAAIADMGGGAAVVLNGEVLARLPLSVAGLMSDQESAEVVRLQGEVEGAARSLGCTLPNPLITLSFLGLTVIPALKITPRGLFDVEARAYLE